MIDKPGKETIYIDVEDEITGIIDKVRHSQSKIVALVLPKKAAALQSIVNLKLLKRKADDANKSLVLITSDTNLLPMAGSVGMHVAKNLQSKPEIPEAPKKSDKAAVIEGDDVDADKSVGELSDNNGVDETIDYDNEDGSMAAAATKLKKLKKKGASKYASKIKIPNFDSFRNRILLGAGALVLLIGLWILAFYVLPKAQITISTNTTTFGSDFPLTADTAAKSVDVSKMTVPAASKSLQKSDTASVAASGKRNDGTKAGGTMTLTNCINDGQPHTVPAGTSFYSNNIAFTTNAAVNLDPSLFSGNTCKSASFGQSKSVAVTAAQPGSAYNLSARGYSSPIDGIVASGSDMGGGSDKIVQIVAQADIDAAKQQVIDKLMNDANTTLTNQFKADKSVALTDTFASSDVQVSPSPGLNEPAQNVTVTVNVKFTALGVKQDDLQKMVEADVGKHINQNEQAIQDAGLTSATLQVMDKGNGNQVKVRLQTQAVIGPKIDQTALKKSIAGKKKGAAAIIIQNRPGVKDVKIDLSPFWVSKIPGSGRKVNIVVKQSNG